MTNESWPRTVWPGAVCNDWFGIFAFYTSLIGLAILILLVAGVYAWLARKLWRMRYRGERW